jgi:hypothetical protein
MCGYAAAFAQDEPHTFAEVQRRVGLGETVLVSSTSGTLRGTVAGVSATSLQLLIDGQSRTFYESDIRLVRRPVRRTSRGALVGLAAGAGVGVAMAKGVGGNPAIGMLSWGPVGAAAGVAIGAGLVRTQVLYAAIGQRAGAVGVARSLDELGLALAPGDRVRISDRNGAHVTGVVVRMDDASIAVLTQEGHRQWAERALQEISGHDSLTNGVVAGLIIGGGLGLFGGAAAAISSEGLFGDAGEGLVFVGAAIGAAIGAASGAAIDRATGQHVLFRAAPTGSMSVAVGPIVSNTQAGALVTVRF